MGAQLSYAKHTLPQVLILSMRMYQADIPLFDKPIVTLIVLHYYYNFIRSIYEQILFSQVNMVGAVDIP